MKILVVDDNLNDKELLFELLKTDGYEVAGASNGFEALEKIRELSPDIVISDIMMSKMDGFNLCRELKKNIVTRTIPIILYSSAYTDAEDEKLVMKEGAVAYIRKPLEINPFLKKIREVITRYRGGEISQPVHGILDDKEYLSLYSRRLMKNLENKVEELEKANNRLEGSLNELETINRLKDNILSNVAHELRTPLTHAMGYVELAISESDEVLKIEFIGRCKAALRRENEVISHLIEASYAEKGLIKPVIGSMDLTQIINETIHSLTPKAKANSISISFDVKEDLVVKGDINQIKHVVSNILDNSIKFNKKGGKVEITAVLDNGMAKICFKDNGIGIPEEKMGKLFEKMYQVDSESTRKFGGIGIGLSISKCIVEANGGRIWANSKSGEGSRFFLTLPVSSENSVKVRKKKREKPVYNYDSIKRKKVLVVEDNILNMELVLEILDAMGFETMGLENGTQALGIIENEQYDLIIMDIELPGKNGVEVMSSIKKKPSYEKVPVVALTACAMKGDRERLILSGFNDYITKPLDVAEFIKKMYTYK